MSEHFKSIAFLTIGDVSSLATMKRALGMANPLISLGWKVSIIAENCIENKKRIQFECNEFVNIYYYDRGSILDEVKSKTKLIKIIKPNFIYFCSFSIRNRIYKYRLGYKPEIIIEHSELPSSIPDNKFFKRCLCFFIEYFSVYYATKLVCASKYLTYEYKKISKKCMNSKIPILYSPYAYNDDVLKLPKVILKNLLIKYDRKKVFLYMGSVAINYGLFTMLNAVKLLKEKREDFVFILMGKGSHLKEAQDFVKINELSNLVEFPGYVPEDELSSYFEISDAFVSPLNNTIQDVARCPSKIYMYMPFKKPIFTCEIGEPKEIFKDNGFYFDNNVPESLYNLMLNVYSIDTNKFKFMFDIHNHSWIKRSKDFDSWLKN